MIRHLPEDFETLESLGVYSKLHRLLNEAVSAVATGFPLPEASVAGIGKAFDAWWSTDPKSYVSWVDSVSDNVGVLLSVLVRRGEASDGRIDTLIAIAEEVMICLASVYRLDAQISRLTGFLDAVDHRSACRIARLACELHLRVADICVRPDTRKARLDSALAFIDKAIATCRDKDCIAQLLICRSRALMRQSQMAAA